MAKFDIEMLLTTVQAFLGQKLNSQISALNTEKNDAITLKQVNSASYHLQYPTDRTEMGDPFVIYDEAAEPVIDAVGPMAATIHQVGVTIVLADNGMDPNMVTRLFRYRRVLEDLFATYWENISPGNRFVVQSWSPTPPFKDMETQYRGRAVGIVLTVALVN